MLAAFDDWDDATDWEHTIGGIHVVDEAGGVLVAHASVIERTIEVDGRPFAAGYVEGVATAPERQGAGHGTAVMARVGELIRERYELGVLGTGALHFYERLGWEHWRGRAYARRAAGLERTLEDEAWLMILRTGPSATIALDGSIACDERPGDDW